MRSQPGSLTDALLEAVGPASTGGLDPVTVWCNTGAISACMAAPDPGQEADRVRGLFRTTPRGAESPGPGYEVLLQLDPPELRALFDLMEDAEGWDRYVTRLLAPVH